VAEAAFVETECARLKLRHTILQWTGEKPTANLQAAARQARYDLIAAYLQEWDNEALVVAHHQDDQAETFLDRLTRGSGVYGLAAMRGVEPNGPAGLTILRPLLTLPKDRLEASLTARGVKWCDDPSNHKTEYKRVRLRQALPLLEAEGLTAGRITETARQMARAADALDHWVMTVLKTQAEQHPAGPIRLPLREIGVLPEEIALRLLGRLASCVTGAVYGPRLEKLESLLTGVMSVEPSGTAGRFGFKQTLGGAVFLVDKGFLHIWREPGRNRPEELIVNPGGEGGWDNRFQILLDARAPQPVTVSAFECVSIRELDPRPSSWPAEVFARAPVVLAEGQTAAFPGAEDRSGLALQHLVAFNLRQSCQI